MGKRLSITMNGVTACSGSCQYCMAAVNNEYTVSCQELINTDILTSKQMHVDWDKLEKVIRDRNPQSIDIWGADPLTCFINLQNLYDMIKDINPGIVISTSTNGLPFKRDDVVEWVKSNDISIQLSHDGCGQCYRTTEDPMDFDSTQELIKCGKLAAINCTLHGLNNSIYKNIEYFNGYLKKIFPAVYDPKQIASKEESAVFRKLYIKLNHIMDGKYKRPDGTDDERFLLKGRALDDYLFEWDVYFEKYRYNQTNTIYYMPYNKYLSEQLHRGSNISDDRCNPCRMFQMGVSDKSIHIDTLGNDTDCNLLDSDHPVPNRENTLPEYCTDCRFKNSGECNMCGAVVKRDTCEYYYRWNQFLLKTRGVLHGGKKCRS